MFKGLGIPLTEEEAVVLSVFRGREYVVYPTDCELTEEQTNEALLGLSRKQIIKGRAPYRLTKLGRRMLQDG